MPATVRKAANAAHATRLEQLPNVGPSIAADFRQIGVTTPAGRDAYALYADLCRVTGRRHDPCVIDVFLSAARFMAGDEPRPWWHYTAERKQTLAGP